MKKNYEMDMTTGALLPKIMLFSVPLMATGMLQLLFNAADVIVVGRFVGARALAAVGSTTSLVNLIIQVFIGLSVGANVCAARYYASERNAELKECISTALATAMIVGCVLVIPGVIAAKPMLEMMGNPPDVIDDAVIYLQIYFLGVPALMLYDFGASLLRAAGDTKRPMYFQLLAGIVNLLLNLFFVIGLGIGVAGVAIATTLSQVVSAALVLIVLIRDPGRMSFDIRHIRINIRIVKSMMEIGLPAGVQGSLFSLSNVCIQSSINSFGSVAMAGSTAAQSVAQFVYAAMNALYQTALSFVSQNIGAGKYSRINSIMYRCLAVVTLIGLVGGLGVYWMGRPLLRIYTPDVLVIEAGMERLKLISAPYFLCGIMDTMVGGLRGLGYSFIPMIISLIGACGLRILYLMTLFRLPEFHSLFWLYMSYPVSWGITFCLHVITYIRIRPRFPAEDGPAEG